MIADKTIDITKLNNFASSGVHESYKSLASRDQNIFINLDK